MNKNLKTFLIIVLVLIIAGGVSAYMMWNKPKRNVVKEKGIEVSAVQLVKEYQDNETEANKRYLDKALQVTGNVSEVKNNQEGKTNHNLII
jgi:flagellar basal body-associated protein FliL